MEQKGQAGTADSAWMGGQQSPFPKHRQSVTSHFQNVVSFLGPPSIGVERVREDNRKVKGTAAAWSDP